jgi:hypothetical protein
VRHTECGWGPVPASLSLAQLAAVPQICTSFLPLSRSEKIGRELVKAGAKLLEYEKKINRGSVERDCNHSGTLVYHCLYHLLNLADAWSVDLEEAFRAVTLRNRDRNARGHYGR